MDRRKWMGRSISIKCMVLISIAILLSAIMFIKVSYFLYGKELWNRLDPISDHENEILNESTTYLFLGDSRIFQWEIPDSVIHSNEYINIGINGQTSGQVLQRAYNYFRKYQSDYVIIQVGINDLKTIGLYPDKAEYITSLTIRNIILLLELCTEYQSTPIFITIIPPGTVELKRIPFWNKKINKSVLEVNKNIASYCERKRINVLNASKLLSNDGLLISQEYQEDCLHLNERGYQVLNSELNRIIN